MAALVRHFGDVADASRTCGKCDACDPAGAVLRLFRRATPTERQWVQDMVESLRGAAYKSVKGLRSEHRWAEGMSRDEFEELLNAMKRSGLIEVENAEFEKDGEVISYRRISLTDAESRCAPDHPAAFAHQRWGGRGVRGRAFGRGPEEKGCFCQQCKQANGK